MPRRFVPSPATSEGTSSSEIVLHRPGPWLVVLLLVLGLATSVQASVLRGLTVKQLRQQSDAIVAGRVVGVRSVLQQGRVETEVRVRVERSFKGSRVRSLRVRVPGGTVGDKRWIVPGAPSFERGSRVLLFLYRAGGSWRPVGLFQGVWRLSAQAPRLAHASDSRGASLLRPEHGVAAIDQPERSVAQLVGRGGAR